MSDTEVHVYAVGILRDWKHARDCGDWRARWRWFKRSWRQRNYWNGYLAEPSPWPDGIGLTRCGSGWTKAGARRDLARRWRSASERAS